MSRAGICLNCKTELKFKKIFGIKLKWCRVCMEFKHKDKTTI